MKNKIRLQDITLVTITGSDIEKALAALIVSSECCEFSAIKIISPQKPNNLPSYIQHIQIPSMNFMEYSRFMIEDLNEYIDTKFCLVVQADGFIINPRLWTDKFLEYDYIGAPWPSKVPLIGQNKYFYFDKNRVGNGGFSLRSKKLLRECARLKLDTPEFAKIGEDMLICHFKYNELLAKGIKYAPIDIAAIFSSESTTENLNNDLRKTFGFHGKHWLDNEYLLYLADKSENSQYFSSLLRLNTNKVPISHMKTHRRLDKCPCNSGKRFKDCHGKLT
jgi:hypothetical protein